MEYFRDSHSQFAKCNNRRYEEFIGFFNRRGAVQSFDRPWKIFWRVRARHFILWNQPVSAGKLPASSRRLPPSPRLRGTGRRGIFRPVGEKWWALLDSNQRPLQCECSVLTNWTKRPIWCSLVLRGMQWESGEKLMVIKIILNSDFESDENQLLIFYLAKN